uniref:Uncharacterized protein n=1 Tax=Timema shepardi TaxID=629360 RepID=A0A7R9FW40_TIMSH|nr:unnamed protein product [Timema shepardi]
MNSWGRGLPRDNSNNWPQHVNHHSRAGFGPASRRSGVDPVSLHPFSSSTPPPPVNLAPQSYHGENKQCSTLPYQHHAALSSIPQLQVGSSAPSDPPPRSFNKDHPPSCTLQLGQTSQQFHKYPPFHQSVDIPSNHGPGNHPPHRSHTGFMPQPHTNSALHWQSAEPSRFGQFYGKPPLNTPLPPSYVAPPKTIPATAQIVSHPQSTLSPRPQDSLPPRMPFPIHKLPTRYTTPPPAVLPQSRPQFPSRHPGTPSHAHPVDIRPTSSHGEADLSVQLHFPGTQPMTQPPPGIVCTYPPPNFLPSSDDGHSQFTQCSNNSTSVCDPKQTFSVPPPTKPAKESSFWVRGDHLSNSRVQNFPSEPVDYQNDPSTVKRSDLHGKDLSKPDKRRSRSPLQRVHIPTKRVRSPPRRSCSPSSHRSRSSSHRRSHSPSGRGRPYPPHQNRDYSPSKKKSLSPVKRRPNTLYRRTSHTPSHGKSRSPSRKNSRTSSKVNTRTVERNNSTRLQTTYGTVKYENRSRTNSNSPCRGEDRSELFRFQAEFEQGVFKEEFPLVSLKKEISLPVVDLDKPWPIKQEKKPILMDILEYTDKEVGFQRDYPQHDKTRKDIEHDSNLTQSIECESNIKNMECSYNSRKDVEYRSSTRKDVEYRSSISKDIECKSNGRKDVTPNSDFKSIPSSTKRRDLSPAESLKYAKSTGSRSSVGVHPRHFRDKSSSRSVSRESWRSSRSREPRSGGTRSRPRSKERSSQGNKLDHASNNSVTEKELANALVVLSSTAEDGEIEVRISVGQNYCATGEEIESKLSELSKMKPEEIIEMEKRVWTRTAPADLYYSRDEKNPKVMRATPRLMELCEKFEKELSTRAAKVRAAQPKFELPPRKNRAKYVKAPNHHKSAVTSSSDTDTNSESSTDEEDCTMEEMERKRLHPYRLHQELWFNDSGEMNDGPLCRCSARARKCGIRHGIYSGESSLMKCDLDTNNADKLYHYRITISPPTNFLVS